MRTTYETSPLFALWFSAQNSQTYSPTLLPCQVDVFNTAEQLWRPGPAVPGGHGELIFPAYLPYWDSFIMFGGYGRSADRFGPKRTTTFRVRILFVRVSPGEPGLGYGPDGRLLEVSEARKPARHGQGQQRQRRIGPDRFVSQHVEPKRGEKEGPLSGSRRSLETRLETFGGNGNRDSLDRFRHPQRNKKRGLWRKRKRQERPFRESLLTKKISLGFSLYGFSQKDCIIILVYFASSPVSWSKREMST